MNYAVGTLVKARGREWVVLPGSTEALLLLNPLGGASEEAAGLLTALEPAAPASFELPDPRDSGDYRSCRLLREALRIGFRNSAGPFRSLGKIAVIPRPYQLVPLLMALKLDPVRLLIADDVGIGKTVEAALIARELLDRGEIERLAVLCPPHLAEQWQKELHDKFHIPAEPVLASTAARLESHCRPGESLFEHYPYVIVSLDFIKSDRRRDEFLRTCPELVIVDEAHTCTSDKDRHSGRHQRHQLVAGIAKKAERHLILVTATPHSGKEAAFRGLLTFLNPQFANLPQDLSGKENEPQRRKLAKYFIQRKRGDIRRYLGENTRFPEREDLEDTYKLSGDHKRFLEKVLRYVRTTVRDQSGNAFQQRVRWWSTLALLRAFASSPAAAAATLRTRSAGAASGKAEIADRVGRMTVLDAADPENITGIDLAPGSDISDIWEDRQQLDRHQRQLREMAREAEALRGEKDNKLQKTLKMVKELLKQGYHPIIFCRFIPTVDYLLEALRQALPKTITISGITGELAPAEREQRVTALEKASRRVLVCTDCLSEGINLQTAFNAVLHYDLSWNPTRHEQREGRVDRFGQLQETIRVITYYGIDNQIDGVVLEVLLRKYKAIRNSLGISVPVPADTDRVMEAIFEGLLLREKSSAAEQLYLPGFEDFLAPQQKQLFKQWDHIQHREKRSRSMFAQERIKVDEVLKALRETRTAIGDLREVSWFVRETLTAYGASISGNGAIQVDLQALPRSLNEFLGNPQPFKARFDLPVNSNEIYLNRTHPLVERLATQVLDSALAADGPHIVARRAGVIRTSGVSRRTTVLLVRFRYHIICCGIRERTLLAENCRIMGFSGAPEQPEWLDDSQIEALLTLQPEVNVAPETAQNFIHKVTRNYSVLLPFLEQQARTEGEILLNAHRQVRKMSLARGIRHELEPVLPPDLLGIYVYLPNSVL